MYGGTTAVTRVGVARTAGTATAYPRASRNRTQSVPVAANPLPESATSDIGAARIVLTESMRTSPPPASVPGSAVDGVSAVEQAKMSAQEPAMSGFQLDMIPPYEITSLILALPSKQERGLELPS